MVVFVASASFPIMKVRKGSNTSNHSSSAGLGNSFYHIRRRLENLIFPICFEMKFCAFLPKHLLHCISESSVAKKEERTIELDITVWWWGENFSRYLNSSAVIGKYVVGRKIKDSGTILYEHPQAEWIYSNCSTSTVTIYSPESICSGWVNISISDIEVDQ